MFGTESVLIMAKKKTAGPDTTTGSNPAAASKRRAPGPKRSDEATARASAVSETFDAGGSVAAADDRGAGLSTQTGATSGHNPASDNGHSAESPSYEEIAEAAYQRYLTRGGDHGRDFEDWVEAERELRSRR